MSYSDVRFVLLARFSTVVEAEMVRELLTREGIPVILTGTSDPLGIVSGAQPLRLLVPESEWERARALYHAFFQKPFSEEDAG
jgi:hypothetical protein